MPCPHGNTHCEEQEACDHGWKKGPFPEDTWLWGAVVPWGEDRKIGSGFYFADFYGKYCVVFKGAEQVKMLPDEVAFYNNSIGLPPQVPE